MSARRHRAATTPVAGGGRVIPPPCRRLGRPAPGGNQITDQPPTWRSPGPCRRERRGLRRPVRYHGPDGDNDRAWAWTPVRVRLLVRDTCHRRPVILDEDGRRRRRRRAGRHDLTRSHRPRPQPTTQPRARDQRRCEHVTRTGGAVTDGRGNRQHGPPTQSSPGRVQGVQTDRDLVCAQASGGERDPRRPRNVALTDRGATRHCRHGRSHGMVNPRTRPIRFRHHRRVPNTTDRPGHRTVQPPDLDRLWSPGLANCRLGQRRRCRHIRRVGS